jgi:hypothetical protein
MKRKLSILAAVVTLTGCASTLPPTVSIDKDFNTNGVKTVSVKMDCTNVRLDKINPSSIPDFCQMLQASAKTSIRRKTGYDIAEAGTDVDITIKLEEMYGGNAAARALVGFGAGRSVITTHIDMVRGGKVIAAGRLVETSTMPNIAGSAWSNEEMITQDVGIIGSRIADFVANPRDFEVKQ